MLDSIPFIWRVILLLALMIIVGGIDRVKNGSKATRIQEYGFILAAGVLGTLVAVGCDLFTSKLSPEYFTLGKGLSSEGLQRQVITFGSKTGFSGGVIAGAVLLFSCGQHRPVWKTLYLRLWLPIVAAIAGGLLFPLVVSDYDPAHYFRQLNDLLTAEQIHHFRYVWWTHTGFYAGLIVGVICLIFWNRHKSPLK